ncbi:MAG: hypothetical protein LBI82_08185 [Dysgonamonadaceae bacterium]|jgi:hypothetical protein|nr:hypothetical protein [Dysgonamonadaceae bacterium]
MNKKKISRLKILYNLILITFVIIALVTSFSHLEIAVALMFAVSFYYIYFFFNLSNISLKNTYFPIVLAVTIIAFLILSGLRPLIGEYIKYGVLFFQVIIVAFLWIIRFFEKRIRNRLIRENKKKRANLSIRLNEYFLIAKLCQYIFTIHLVIVFFYKFYFVQYQTPGLTHFLFSQLNMSLVFIVTIYGYIRVVILRTEKWLPIVSENGNVIGKIAHSVSFSSDKRFLHPFVRIALIHNNLLYLSKRASNNIIEPDKLDFPLESFVRYGHTLDETVNHILQEKVGLNNLHGKLVFKHICKQPSMHGLVHLYTVQIPSSQQIETANFREGKWWTEKHIEENLNKGVFAECFEMEYNVLKNTILLANRIITNQSPKEKKEKDE